MEGYLPSQLKETIIMPIPKNPSLAKVSFFSNYKQISNIPFLGKLIERMGANQLQAF